MSDTIEWIDDPARFAALAAEWDDVARSSGYPFMRYAWLASWWHAFSKHRRLLICTARRDGRLAAALPLWRRRSLASALSNAHTPTFTPIALDESALAAVVEAAVAARFPSLVVGPLPADDAAVGLLLEASRRARRHTWIAAAHASPVVDILPGGVEDYRRRLPRSTRRELERLRRKLEREHPVTFETLAEPEDPRAALQRGLEVEKSGWKGRRGTAILSAPDTAAFYREVASRLASEGALRLSTLEAGRRVLAFDFAIVSDGALWLPKGAYDEAFSRYAPGLLLLLAEIERAHELGLDRVELLGTSEPYKLKFASRVRQHAFVHSHSWRPAPTARAAWARVGRPAARAVYRRTLRRRR
jgi:CelD/BcsL family acetyltransferase involved in cellulose biosynthesis